MDNLSAENEVHPADTEMGSQRTRRKPHLFSVLFEVRCLDDIHPPGLRRAQLCGSVTAPATRPLVPHFSTILIFLALPSFPDTVCRFCLRSAPSHGTGARLRVHENAIPMSRE